MLQKKVIFGQKFNGKTSKCKMREFGRPKSND
jgi:hypothetical protein